MLAALRNGVCKSVCELDAVLRTTGLLPILYLGLGPKLCRAVDTGLQSSRALRFAVI